MPCDCLCRKGVHQAATLIHIGRIGCHHIKRGCPEQLHRFLDIPLFDGNPFLQLIQKHTAVCHFRTLRLNFQTGKMLSFCFCRQKNRNNACACA